jgi:hypothetical protein
VAFLILALLALNSKEMAFMLAPALWVYEFVYRGWSFRNKFPLWILTAATPVAAIVKTGSSSSFYGVGSYEVHFNWMQWLETTRYWIEGLLYMPYRYLTLTGAVLIMLVPWAIALFVRDRERRKPFLLCAALVWMLPLPVNFIDQRGFFVMYIPLAAWAVIAAHGLTGMWDRVLEAVGRLFTRRGWQATRSPSPHWARIALAAIVVPLLHAAQHHDKFHRFEWTDPSQPGIRAFAAGLAEYCPSIPTNGRVEVFDDPFDKTGWEPTFITRLWTHREDIEVHREPPAPSDGPSDHYDCTLAYRDGEFRQQ